MGLGQTPTTGLGLVGGEGRLPPVQAPSGPPGRAHSRTASLHSPGPGVLPVGPTSAVVCKLRCQGPGAALGGRGQPGRQVLSLSSLFPTLGFWVRL